MLSSGCASFRPLKAKLGSWEGFEWSAPRLPRLLSVEWMGWWFGWGCVAKVGAVVGARPGDEWVDGDVGREFLVIILWSMASKSTLDAWKRK